MTIEIDLKIKHYMPTPGNDVYMKEMRLDSGHYGETHSHPFDHYSILIGRAVVELEGESEEIENCVVEIKAGKKHRFIAKTDIIVFCVHGTKETDPDHIDDVLLKGD